MRQQIIAQQTHGTHGRPRRRRATLDAVTPFLAMVIAVIFFAGGVVPSASAAAAYPNATLVSYGIPENVVRVICDNSLMTDGKAPCKDGITAAAMTVADVQKMTVFSLADRTAAGDSTTNTTVAAWVGKIISGAAAIWQEGATNPQQVLTADESSIRSDAVLRYDLWTDASMTQKILTDGVPKYTTASGAANSWNTPTPAFNALIAIANSAVSATTIDLTGLLSQVDLSATTFPGIRLKLLSLLQGKALSKLTTLKLGYNGIGIDSQACANSDSSQSCTDSAANWFQMGPLGAPNLDALYLDNNDIHAIDATLLSVAAQTVSRLYLNGNDLSTLNYQNGGFFQNILSNSNAVLDLSGNLDISDEDKNTLFVLEKAIETNGASITIDQSVLSATLIAAISDTTWRGTLTVKGLESVADRIDTSVLSAWLAYSADDSHKYSPLTPTAGILEAIMSKSATSVQGLSDKDKANLQKVIDSTTDADVKAALGNMLTLANTPISSIKVTGSLDFGSIGIEQLYKGTPVESTSKLTMTGTLGANQHITVEASQWSAGSESGSATFTPDLTLQITGTAGNLTVDSTVNLTSGTPVTVAPVAADTDATSDAARDFSLTVSKATLTNLPVTLGAGQYSGNLTWNLVTGP